MPPRRADHKRIDEAAKRLRKELKTAFGAKEHEALFDALEQWIDAKIILHKRDLDDQIEKRYNPYYDW